MRALKVFAVGLLLCGLPVLTYAQAEPLSNNRALSAVAREIRLLRETLQKQNSAAARAQLLIAQLTLQDQRAGRARETVEQLEGEVGNLEQERHRMHTSARELDLALAEAVEEEHQRSLEAESQVVRARLEQFQSQVGLAHARLRRAKETLDLEEDRYYDLETRLNDLDKRLQGDW